MNKKKSFFVLLRPLILVLVLFVLAGCSRSEEPLNQENQANQSQAENRGFRNMPDFGQPDRPADFRGVIKSITGNQAIILKMEQIDRGGLRASSTPENPGSGPTSGALSLVGGGQNPGAQGGGPMGGGGGAFAGPGGQGDASSRAAMLEQLKALSTGEETITIPVGIQMLKASTDQATNNRDMVEATLADITADKFISVWLNTSVTDKKVADFILIN